MINDLKKPSTFEKKMKDPEFKKAFDESYQDLIISEGVTQKAMGNNKE